ncbi:hypothetical protein EVAR_95294_1 [Eumeta japonica]|uniref:Uncharacterized protein n=1 Tax=Eumeta variegata TaxID=151549 RepID=A0A4C1UAH9_EUMVA|nr:hypothetical protein EVAR_95294_1 [Eumeta japonica]
MNTLGLNCGPNSHRYAEKIYAARVKVADKATKADNTQEDGMLRRQQKIDILEASTTAKELLYGPEIDGSIRKRTCKPPVPPSPLPTDTRGFGGVISALPVS